MTQTSSLSVDQKLDLILAEVFSVKKDMKQMKKELTRVKKTQVEMLDYFDRRLIKLDERVIRVEDHLNLPALLRDK